MMHAYETMYKTIVRDNDLEKTFEVEPQLLRCDEAILIRVKNAKGN